MQRRRAILSRRDQQLVDKLQRLSPPLERAFTPPTLLSSSCAGTERLPAELVTSELLTLPAQQPADNPKPPTRHSYSTAKKKIGKKKAITTRELTDRTMRMECAEYSAGKKGFYKKLEEEKKKLSRGRQRPDQ